MLIRHVVCCIARPLFCRSTAEHLQQLGEAKATAEAARDQLVAEKEQLLPQLEQARWNNRQLEKKLEEAAAGRNKAEQVRPPQRLHCCHATHLCIGSVIDSPVFPSQHW